MELTDEQQALVDHTGGHARLLGAAGTGKTSALVARYLRQLDHHNPSSILVLCRHRTAANRFRDAVLPHMTGGLEALPITTFFGLAHDVVTRHRGPVAVLSGREQRAVVGRLLAGDDSHQWPTLGHLLHRTAFVEHVARAVLYVQGSRAPMETLPGVWHELGQFVSRYRQHLAARHQLDAAGLLAEAVELLQGPDVRGAEAGRFPEVLVDDYETASAATNRLVGHLADLGSMVTVTGNPGAAIAGRLGADPVHLEAFAHRFGTLDMSLTRVFRAPAAPVLISCTHPSVEPEAIAGELLASHDEGTAWSDMAVLLRHTGHRARAVERALIRHGIPVAPLLGAPSDEPVVRAVVDMLRWTAGDDTALDRLLTSPLVDFEATDVRRIRREAEASDEPLESHPALARIVALRDRLVARAATDNAAELAFQVWQHSLTGLAAGPSATDERALDALVTFIDGLARHAERQPDADLIEVVALLDDDDVEPDPWRVSNAAGADAVVVTSITGAAGSEWGTVVVAGCVEGELPHVDSRPPLFDPALIVGHSPPSPAECRRASLAEERRLFALALGRAGRRVIATAAPQPGVLVSRFVEGWTTRPVNLPLAPGDPPAVLTSTPGTVPAFPDHRLFLSASQLDTYDDCPLRYAYEYVLRVRGEAGVPATLGTLVHEVLAEFLDPARPAEERRDRDALMALAAIRWRDDIARYRPQVEEARRDFFAMLESWWEVEGQGAFAPEVLAVERRFEVDVGPHRLTGSIDRIDRADDGVGVRIVDYKTGRKEPSADAMPDNLQLAVYHLAAERQPELAALGPPTQLRLLFLRTMHAFDQPIAPDHATVTEERVLNAAERILAEEFEPSLEANCRICSFHRLCPIQDEGRHTGDHS